MKINNSISIKFQQALHSLVSRLTMPLLKQPSPLNVVAQHSAYGRTSRKSKMIAILLLSLLIGSGYQFADTKFAAAQVADMQSSALISLADIDFRVTVATNVVSPGEVVPFQLTVTNTQALPLHNVALVTTLPPHTTYSSADSSVVWNISGRTDMQCGENIPPSTLCSYTIDTLSAGEVVHVIFAIRIDQNIPADTGPISLFASMYPAGQQPVSPIPPISNPGGQSAPSAEQDQRFFLPLIE